MDRKCWPLSRGASLSFVAAGFWCVRLWCVGSFDLSRLLFTECSGWLDLHAHLQPHQQPCNHIHHVCGDVVLSLFPALPIHFNV